MKCDLWCEVEEEGVLWQFKWLQDKREKLDGLARNKSVMVVMNQKGLPVKVSWGKRKDTGVKN